MNMGLAGDVNNSIFQTNAYPFGRTYGSVPASGTDFSYRNNFSGELGGLNQDYRGLASMQMRTDVATNMSNAPVARNGNGNKSKPSVSWLAFAVIFFAFIWIARRFAPDGEQFANLKPSLINGVFLTFWTILILTLLKVVAGKIKETKIPFLQSTADLVLAA